MRTPHGGTRGLLSALAAGSVPALALAACGGSSSTLDTAAVEREIAASILSQRGVHTTVQCPANVPSKAGLAFTCVAKLDVGTYPVAVTEKDDNGHVRYGNQAPLNLLDVARIQQAIAESTLAQRKLHASVSCPTTVLQEAGLRFTCTATIAGRSYPFEVTQLDSSGRVKYVGR